MSRFTLSCTTCTLRAPGKDELLETLEHAPAAGFEYWGVAGPPVPDTGGASVDRCRQDQLHGRRRRTPGYD